MNITQVDREITHLVPALQPKCRAVIADVNGHLNTGMMKLCLFETRRAKLRQAWLFATGKSKTLWSKHLDGKAFDVVFMVYDAKRKKWDWSWDVKLPWDLVDSAAKAHGLTRISWDRPHCQLN